jgi:nucleotide-binding universal stress UspA family protein
MFNNRILVTTDGSALSDKAVQCAVECAAALKCELVALTVMPVYPYAGIGESSGMAAAEHQGRVGAEASARLATVEQRARAAGVVCHTSMREHDAIYLAIIEAADEHDCGLIVMASHGRRDVRALVLGSETQRVLTHTTRPVMVVR